jgi:hypothetical protein
LINGTGFISTNGGVFRFDGTDDYVNSQRNLGSNPFNSIFTYLIWFRTSINSGRKMMGIEGTTGVNTTQSYDRHLYLGLDGKIRYSSFNSGQKNISSSLSTYGDNRWHNATITNDGTTISLYCDGIFDNSILGSGFNAYTVSYVKIGGTLLGAYPSADSGNAYWTGSLSCAQIYNRSLSATEVLQNYNALKGRFGLT